MTIAERIGFEKGLVQGREQGLEQGRLEGGSKFLSSLIERKFKAIPDNYRQKLQEAANFDTLLRWGDRVLFATTIEEVFAEE